MVTCFKNQFDLKDCILYIIYRMGFLIKYETEEERLGAIHQSKNNYSNKPFTCSHCSVTILLGNKHKRKNTKKH